MHIVDSLLAENNFCDPPECRFIVYSMNTLNYLRFAIRHSRKKDDTRRKKPGRPLRILLLLENEQSHPFERVDRFLLLPDAGNE